MSSIRPLATITLLAALGYVLWTRINTPSLEQLEESTLAEVDAPPLASTLPASEEPRAIGAPPPYVPQSTTGSDSTAGGEFSFGPEESAAPQAETIQPLDTTNSGGLPELPPLPSNIPTANYSGGSTPGASVRTPIAPAASLTSPNISGQVPELGTQVGGTSAEQFDFSSETPPPPPAGVVDNMNLPALPELPLGVGQEFAGPASAYADAKPAIETALARGELERAHLLLTSWYGDRTLSPEERDEVDSLLSQLAGTVVYSPEHRLEAPHTVRAGETLETIAQKYQVPWQLLAKINGVAEPNAVTPGQELKVIRGPFSAVIDVERQELALMVAGRYAGRFTVKTEGAATSEGEWVVAQKQLPGGAETTGQVVLDANPPQPGASIVMAPMSDASPTAAGAIRVSPQDQSDLFDILSIGSKVIVRK